MRLRVDWAAAAVLALLMSSQAAGAVSKTLHHEVSRGTEHKLATHVGPGKERFCVWAINAQGAQGRFHLRRSLDGRPNNPSYHRGRTCLFTRPGTYVVYAGAPHENLTIYIQLWGSAWNKPASP